MRKRTSKNLKKNPVPLLVVGGMTLLSSTGALAILGVGGLGLALAASLSESDYTPKTYAIWKQVKSLLTRIDNKEFKDVDGYTPGLHVTRDIEINAATQAPTSVAQAYLQASYLLALASIYNGNDSGLAKEATKFFNKLPKVEAALDMGSEDNEEIIKTLNEAQSILKSHPQASKFSRLITEVDRKNDANIIQSQRNWEADHSAEQYKYKAMVKTVDEASRPFQLGAALWTGKKPHFLSPTQWGFVKYGAYSLLGLGIFFTIKAYLPKPPS